MKQIELTNYGTDVWQYELMAEGGEVRVRSLRGLLLYIYSPGTQQICLNPYPATKSARIEIVGPICDDETPLEVVYRATREEVEHPVWGLSYEEQALLYQGVKKHYRPGKNLQRQQALQYFRQALNLPLGVG